MKKVLNALLALVLTTSFLTAQTDTVSNKSKGTAQTDATILLKRGESISFEFAIELNSAGLKVGSTVPLLTTRAVIVDGYELIHAKAEAEAIVRDVQQAHGFGRGGRIVLEVTRVWAFDGRSIALKSKELFVAEGKSRKGRAWLLAITGAIVGGTVSVATLGAAGLVVGVPCLTLGAAVKGGDAMIDKTDKLSAYVVESKEIFAKETENLKYASPKN